MNLSDCWAVVWFANYDCFSISWVYDVVPWEDREGDFMCTPFLSPRAAHKAAAKEWEVRSFY